jgi:hypothetical protein
MYRWDSPFREQWHLPGTWKRTMQTEGFEDLFLESVSNPSDRGFRKLLKTNRFFVIAGRLTTKPMSIPPAPPTAELKEADSVLIHGAAAPAASTPSEPHAKS